MRKIGLDEFRKVSLNILLEIDKFCHANDIRYSLMYGTLLGAVRHKGFIPWDDDIDIMMPRPDYERFIKTFPGTVYYLRLENYDTDDLTPISWTKVCDVRTVTYTPSMQTSVFVDVFPIDGAPDDEHVEEHIRETIKRRNYVIKKRKSYKYGKNRFVAYAKYVIKCFLYPKNRRRAIAEYESYILSHPFDMSPNAGRPGFWFQPLDIMPAKVFKEYETILFEGHEVMCIKDYDTFLRRTYGDYMKLPTKEQQVRWHDYPTYWLDGE